MMIWFYVLFAFRKMITFCIDVALFDIEHDTETVFCLLSLLTASRCVI